MSVVRFDHKFTEGINFFIEPAEHAQSFRARLKFLFDDFNSSELIYKRLKYEITMQLLALFVIPVFTTVVCVALYSLLLAKIDYTNILGVVIAIFLANMCGILFWIMYTLFASKLKQLICSVMCTGLIKQHLSERQLRDRIDKRWNVYD